MITVDKNNLIITRTVLYTFYIKLPLKINHAYLGVQGYEIWVEKYLQSSFQKNLKTGGSFVLSKYWYWLFILFKF